MRHVLMLFSLPVFLALTPAAGIADDDSEALGQVSEAFVEAQRSSGHGGQRSDYSAKAFTAEIEAKKRQLAKLEAIDPENLTTDQDIDRRLLLGILRSDIKTLNTLRRWENDPALYLPSARLGALLAPDYPAGEEARAADLKQLIETLPARLAHGKSNLKRPPRRFTEAAVFQAKNTLESLISAQSDLPALVSGLEQAIEQVRDYLAFLEQDILPRSDGSWALGRDAYDFVLRERWHMKDDADSIHRRGLQAFEETEALAMQTAERMKPGAHWTEVYETLKDDHPAAGELKQAYQAQMDAAQAFVKQHHMLTLPDGERVITLDTPPAMRRSSPFGTFDMVDPFDDNRVGKLMLTPVEDWMTPEQKAARLRSHHNAWIPVIAVHEAYPGHHAHGIKLMENPSRLRRAVSEAIFTEGWGLFTEELMFEQGFLKGDAVRLTQLRNRLWRAARVILDSGLHTGRMTFDDAVQFLVEKVRFDPYAAELEVGMYIREPTYVLGYLIGMQEIEAIRAEWIERFGAPEPLSDFYDPLLTAGSLPPALVREILFRKP